MLCVDASVAIKWILPEVDSDLAFVFLDSTARAHEVIIAPRLIRYEVTNILRQRQRRGQLPGVGAEVLLHQFLQFGIRMDDPAELHEAALSLAIRYNLPAAYDAHYLALAQAHDCDFWTADQRLYNTVSASLGFVRLLREYHPTS